MMRKNKIVSASAALVIAMLASLTFGVPGVSASISTDSYLLGSSGTAKSYSTCDSIYFTDYYYTCGNNTSFTDIYGPCGWSLSTVFGPCGQTLSKVYGPCGVGLLTVYGTCGYSSFTDHYKTCGSTSFTNPYGYFWQCTRCGAYYPPTSRPSRCTASVFSYRTCNYCGAKYYSKVSSCTASVAKSKTCPLHGGNYSLSASTCNTTVLKSKTCPTHGGTYSLSASTCTTMVPKSKTCPFHGGEYSLSASTCTTSVFKSRECNSCWATYTSQVSSCNAQVFDYRECDSCGATYTSEVPKCTREYLRMITHVGARYFWSANTEYDGYVYYIPIGFYTYRAEVTMTPINSSRTQVSVYATIELTNLCLDTTIADTDQWGVLQVKVDGADYDVITDRVNGPSSSTTEWRDAPTLVYDLATEKFSFLQYNCRCVGETKSVSLSWSVEVQKNIYQVSGEIRWIVSAGPGLFGDYRTPGYRTGNYTWCFPACTAYVGDQK